MKILFIFISLPHLSQHSIYSDLINEFQKNGHEISVIAPIAKGCAMGLHDENGCKVVRIKSRQVVGNKSMFSKGIGYLDLIFKNIKVANKFFDNEKFDLIYTNSLPLEISVVASYLKKKYKCKYYLQECDYIWQCLISYGIQPSWSPIIRYYKWLERKLFKTADYISGLSQAYIDFAVKYHPFVKSKNTEIVFPFTTPIRIEFEDREKVKEKIGLKGKFVILYGGTVGMAQSIENVIDLAKACMDYKDIAFLIVGRGAKIEQVKEYAKSNAISNITFLSFMPKEEYLNVLHASDIGIVSLNIKSSVPNFPSKTAELFNLNIPVVASTGPVPDLKYYFNKYNMGLWSLAGDLEAFKNNILLLYKNKGLREEVAKNANDFYWKNMTPEIAYKTIISQINRD